MKKRTKYFMALMASFCVVVVSGCSSDSIKIKSGQKLVYGEVEKIVGNEVVLSRKYEGENEKEKKDSSVSGSELSTDEAQSNSASMESEEESEESSGLEEEAVVVLQLPVGMPIHKEKKEISFKEIEEGDPLKIVLEKDSVGVEVPIEAWVAELTEKEKKDLEKQEVTAAVTTGEEEPSSTEGLPSSEPSSELGSSSDSLEDISSSVD